MFKLINSFIKPNILNIEKINENTSIIILEPIEKGFGNTIGNSLRRILLSYIPGYKITEVEINEIDHEYSIKKNIKEDILEIILNIKNIQIKLNNKEIEYININKNFGIVLCEDILYNDKNVEIINKKHYLFNIIENTNIDIKMKVERGIGYLHRNIIEKKNNIGKILLDAYFSPINRVIYKIEKTRVNNRLDLDKLIFEIETNGSINAEEAIKISANILVNQLNIFLNLNKINDNNDNENLKKNNNIKQNNYNFNNNKYNNINKINKLYHNLNPIVFKSINNLNLTVRSLNCLKNNNILYIGDLIQIKESNLLKFSNLGKKSLIEIKNTLKSINLNLNYNINNWNKIINNLKK